jgi:hypothetical protein
MPYIATSVRTIQSLRFNLIEKQSAYIFKLITDSLPSPIRIYSHTLQCRSLPCQSHTPTTCLRYPKLYAVYTLYLNICFTLFIFLLLSLPVSCTFTSLLPCFITMLFKFSTYVVASIPIICQCHFCLFLHPKVLLMPLPHQRSSAFQIVVPSHLI